MRRVVGIALAVVLAFAVASCVRQVVLSPTPDGGDPDAILDGDGPPDAVPDAVTDGDGNGVLPDAAVGG